MTANRVQPYLDDGDVTLYYGDGLEVLASLPAGIAQTCVTSPPYWGLRDYNAPGQLGLEATPAEYVQNMVALFREVRRCLRDDGTLWLNLGDSYAAGTQGRNDSGRDFTGGGGNYQDDAPGPRVNRTVPGLKPKDLVGIPWRVAFALQADGWYLRSDIIWAKPNPMPESVTDRPTKAHEYVFLFSKQPRYYMDMDAIREPNTSPEQAEHNERYAREYPIAVVEAGQNGSRGIHSRGNAAGRNRRSVWTIPTEPFPEAHFASYPQALVRPCILAGTSERGGCAECGVPWSRKAERVASDSASQRHHERYGNRPNNGKRNPNRNDDGGARMGGFGLPGFETTGWNPSCSCNAPTRPQLVLDPFVGSGTTALVARKHGRRCIGIDLSSEYLAIAAKRTQQLSLLGGVA